MLGSDIALDVNTSETRCLKSISAALLTRTALHWYHNDHSGVSNHQPHGCLLNRLFRRRSKKTSKLHVTGLCVENSPGPVNYPHKGPVTRKMFPFDDVIMDEPLKSANTRPNVTSLTNWGRDKMADILQTIFQMNCYMDSNFSEMCSQWDTN